MKFRAPLFSRPNLFILVLSAGLTLARGAPIRLLPENPRYFEWDGHPLVLVASGEHYGSVVNPDFDYVKYLSTIQTAGLNHTRIFLGDYIEAPGAFGIVDNSLAPPAGRFLAPWARSAVSGYALGGNRFDLDHWNPEYFARLHAFLDEAGRRGIVVEAVLFFAGPTLANHPLFPKNNINGTTEIGPASYLSLANGNVLARQEAYCRQLVRELNRHDNLIVNLCNEPWFYNQENPSFASPAAAPVKAWIQRVAEWVRSEEAALPQKHLLSVDLMNQGARIPADELTGVFRAIDVFNVHYDANAAIVRENPALGRALAFNETGFNGTADDYYRTQGWNFLLSGGSLYGNLDFSFTVGHEDGSATPRFATGSYNGGGSAALRRQLKILQDFMLQLPLARMHPDNSVVVGGADSWVALASPGEALAIWFPGSGAVDALINLPAGEWNYEWVDILTGTITRQVASHTAWVAQVHGERQGGGVALRITRTAPLAASASRVGQAGSATGAPLAPESAGASDDFATRSGPALEAMRTKAAQLNIGGVAVIAFFEGPTLRAWTSRMSVVDRYKDSPTSNQAGNNLLGIAYAKAAEMADTRRNSGAAGRPPMTGEFGWPGGAIREWHGGYLIAAFSGGKSEDDLAVSQAGLAAFVQ
jgi:hypothetical protein